MPTLLEPETKTTQFGGCDTRYQSWGRFPRLAHRSVKKVASAAELRQLLQNAEPGSLLPHGMGRSYGDSCLNEGRDLIDCTSLNRILEADWTTGRIRVEAGMSFADLLKVIVPQGWFLPVTPGTKFVTVGGAIANDVHGKNHHRAGTFGCHVDQMELYRSDGSFLCSPSRESDLFRATIGGLGLTGVIAWADIRLRRIAGNGIETETIPFEGLNEFVSLSEESDQSFEYTVAWLDSLSGSRVRGIFFRGNHADKDVPYRKKAIKVPFAFPAFALKRGMISLFNAGYYRLNAWKSGSSLTHYDQFFYPLDSVLNWNLLYGQRGFVQYQCVIPNENAGALTDLLQVVQNSGQGSFLTVLKAFGKLRSPGLLSFPRQGLTLAMDFPMQGSRTLQLLASLDEVVRGAGGRVYPAKDARMTNSMFQDGFPQWREFAALIDPVFSSSFWRRVANP